MASPSTPPRSSNSRHNFSYFDSPHSPGVEAVFSPGASDDDPYIPDSPCDSVCSTNESKTTTSSKGLGLGISNTPTASNSLEVDSIGQSEISSIESATWTSASTDDNYKQQQASTELPNHDGEISQLCLDGEEQLATTPDNSTCPKCWVWTPNPQACLQCRVLSLRCSLEPRALPPDYEIPLLQSRTPWPGESKERDPSTVCTHCTRRQNDTCIPASIIKDHRGNIHLQWHSGKVFTTAGMSSAFGGMSLADSKSDRGQFRSERLKAQDPDAREKRALNQKEYQAAIAAEILAEEQEKLSWQRWALPSWTLVGGRRKIGSRWRADLETREAAEKEEEKERMVSLTRGM